MLFLKFQYGNKIKKIQLNQEELSWSNISDILTKSFLIGEKDKIKITYKDLDNDEITVRSDEDLNEACNLYLMKNLIKFFVYYSGNVKAESPKNNKGSRKSSQDDNEKVKTIGSAEKKEAGNSGNKLESSQKHVQKLQIDAKELEEIFTEVFAETDIIRKIQEKVGGFVKKATVDPSEVLEYSVETDYNRISQHMMSKVNEIVNQRYKDILSKSSPVIVDQSTSFDKHEESKTSDQPAKLSTVQETPLAFSCFETVIKTNSETKAEPVKKDETPKTAGNDLNKSLMDSSGFRFVMKFENGKAKFVPVSTNSAGSQLEKVEEQLGYNFESLNETLDSVPLNLKKTTSKREDEFAGKLLKDNMHDLDEDLPAPYDHTKVQKYEEGLTSQKFEKICK